MKILFKLTFRREVVTSVLQYIYDCFDYFFQVLLVNLKYCNSQGLNKKLKLMGGAMNFFSEKLLGREIFGSMVSWATKYFLKSL